MSTLHPRSQTPSKLPIRRAPLLKERPLNENPTATRQNGNSSVPVREASKPQTKPVDDFKMGPEVGEEAARPEIEPLAQALSAMFDEMRGDEGTSSRTQPVPGAETQMPYAWLTEPEYANPETRSFRGFAEAAGDALEFVGETLGAGAREAIASTGEVTGRFTEAVGSLPGDVVEAAGLSADLLGLGGGDSLRAAGAAVDRFITPHTGAAADFQRSFATGLGQGTEAMFAETAYAAANPVQTVVGLADFASSAISDPVGTVQDIYRDNREDVGTQYEEGGIAQTLGYAVSQLAGFGRNLVGGVSGAAN